MGVKAIFGLFVALLAAGFLQPVAAFDYLEHSLFADRACYESQKILATSLGNATVETKGRYLALSLMCPVRWRPAYCAGGRKNVSSTMTPEGRPPITLGDYAALVDHITEYGRVRNLAGAEDHGFVDLTWKWLLPGKPAGVARDIAREECVVDHEPDWLTIEDDIDDFMGAWHARRQVPRIESSFLAEGKRAELRPGPADPSALFAIRNPRFLDLQLFNQTHFGVAAYRTWAGMHHTAISVADLPCEDVIDLDESTASRLAGTVGGFNHISWDKEKNPKFRADSCRLLSEVLRQRLKIWGRYVDNRFSMPVSNFLTDIENGHPSNETLLILQRLPAQVVGLSFEAAGAHFMQDALSGGHVRTEHNGRSLNTTRRYHDIDSKNGVVVTLATREYRYDFIAFGDTYLLGEVAQERPKRELSSCERRSNNRLKKPAEITSCLLGYQRGMLTAANAASITDWALGGVMYNTDNSASRLLPPPKCPADKSASAFVCAFLPLQPITPTATASGTNTGYLAREGLPPTPPPVDFQSLRIESFLDGAGYGTQFGARLEFLIPFLKRGGDWLYSYDFGFLMTMGDPGRQQLIHEFAFTFHYRLATRFLINAGPLTYVGFEGFSSRTNFFFGTGLGAGITILPEGWTKIPLELTLSYRAPWRFVDTNRGLEGQKMDGHWVGLSIGLAFL